MIIVYGLFSSEDGRIRYIGQTKNSANSRLKSHIRECFGKNPAQTYKGYWIRKVLSEGFQVQIAILKENAVYNLDEIAFIKQFKELGADLVNATGGGDHAFDISPTARAKMRNRKLGRKASAETKAKLSAMRKGRKQSAEWIKKRIETRRINNNFKHTEETKEKISKSLSGKKIPPERIEKSRQGVQHWWDERRGII